MEFLKQLKGKEIALVFIVVLTIKLMLTLLSPLPIVPDEIERMRVSEIIAETGEYPTFDAFIEPEGAKYVYAPLPDYLLAFVYTITGQDMHALQRMLALLAFLGFMYFIWKFMQTRFTTLQQSIALLFIGLNPLLLKRFSSFVNETAGLFLFAVVLYFLGKEKQNVWLNGLLLAILGGTHFRSFSLAIGILIVYAGFHWVKKHKEVAVNAIKSLSIGIALLLPFIVLNWNQLTALHGVVNPFIRVGIDNIVLFLGVPLLIAGVLVFGAWKTKALYKEDVLTKMWFIVPFFLFLPTIIPQDIINQSYRQIAFFIPALAMLASIPVAEYFQSKVRWKHVFAIVLLLGLVFSIGFTERRAFDAEDNAAVQYLDAHVQKDTTVLALEESFLLIEKGFRVVLAPYMERIPGATERLYAVLELYKGIQGIALMKEYSVECVLAENEFTLHENIQQATAKVYTNSKKSVYCIPEETGFLDVKSPLSN